MKSILQLIQSDISLWDEFYIPSIESFWKNKKVIGKGSTGTVYEIDSKTIMKVQTFFYQGKNRGNEIFLKKSPDNKIIYVKESFLHEALILQEVNSSLLPKIHDCRFGYYQNKLVSILFMERVAGTEYKPWTYQPPQLLQLFKPFLQELDKLYKKYKFIHGDLITGNLLISSDQKLKMIDVGLSSIIVKGTFICRFHTMKNKLIPLLFRDKIMLQKIMGIHPFHCKTLIHFIQEHRQAVDLCKLLSYSFEQFSKPLRNKFLTCVGTNGNCLSSKNKPNPFYYSRDVITFEEVLKELK